MTGLDPSTISALTNGGFAALFVALLLYVLKTSEAREKRLLDALDETREIIANDLRAIKTSVDDIKSKVV